MSHDSTEELLRQKGSPMQQKLQSVRLKIAKLQDPRCTRCPLCATSENGGHVCVMGRGWLLGPKLGLIGEAPGAHEANTGKPFMGPSGQLLNELILKAGLDLRYDVYITNICKCRPPSNRRPTPRERAICMRNFGWFELSIVRPKVLILLGRTAVDEVFRGKPFKRGQLFPRMHGYSCIPTWHPSYALRTGSQMVRRDIVEALQNGAAEAVRLRDSER